MSDRSQADRRKHPRLAIELPVQVTLVEAETGRPIAPAAAVRLVNLSRGGLCAPITLPEGEDVLEKLLTRQLVLRGEVDLGGARGKVSATARPAWCERTAAEDTYRMGLAFSEMGEEDRQRLEGFIADYLSAE